jgi:outer membrane protein W
MSRLAAAVIAVVFSAAVPSRVGAQEFELSGFSSYTPSIDLENRAPELDRLAIREGFTWGIQLSEALTPHWSAEILWTLQHSALETGTAAGTADLFTMTVGQLQGNAVYSFGDAQAKLRPFVFGGLGVTFFHADDLESEAKLSFGLGGGIKYFFSQKFGVRGHFRYKPTLLNDTNAGTFCDPFGFCQKALQQIEIAAGAIVRF